MQLIGLMMFTFVGMGLIAALSAALYASLPRSFLESAGRHGRFHGLQPAERVLDGTPAGSLPSGALSGQVA
jgi:hypothetical protein